MSTCGFENIDMGPHLRCTGQVNVLYLSVRRCQTHVLSVSDTGLDSSFYFYFKPLLLQPIMCGSTTGTIVASSSNNMWTYEH